MILKARICLVTTVLLALFSEEGRADRRPIVVTDASTSGKLVRITMGARQGLQLGEPVLFSAASKKVAAGRIVRVEDATAVVAVMEKYGSESPAVESDYELLFGEPFPEAANLPDYVADRDDHLPNPANEKFHVPPPEETAPELDDDNYNPEVTLHPKMPEPRTYSPHNISVGLQAFRNRALATDANYSATGTSDYGHTTYNGYVVRYAYTWRTHYWLKTDVFALLSAEASVGIYNFSHTFPTEIRPNPGEQTAEVRVLPIGMELRYMWEVNKLFRLYPYVGFQYNIVGAANGSLMGLEDLRGSRLTGGAGAQLVMSNTIDARLEGGSDGVLGALVVKF